MVESRCKRQLVFSLGHAFLYLLHVICATIDQASAKLLDGWRLDEEAHGLVSIELLDVASSLHIHIEDYILSCLQLAFHLFLQGSIETILINFLILQELAVLNFLAELIGREEKKYSTPFCSVPRGGRLVALILNASFSSGCSFISHCMMVLFPLPEGAEKISRLPLFFSGEG